MRATNRQIPYPFWAFAALAATGLCAGCIRVSSGEGATDARPGDLARDGPGRDGHPDGLVPDGPRPDGPRPDGPRPDGPRPDDLSTADLGPGDLALDAPREAGADAAEPERFDAVGSGTAADPYLLQNAAQWLDLAATSGAWHLHFRLIDDIDLGAIAGDHPPIGTPDAPFAGVVDGDEHVISGFVNNSRAANNGLFGYIDGPSAGIEGLAVENADVEGAEPTGALVGLLVQGRVRNAAAFGNGCYVRSASYANHKGGLIGRVEPLGVVEDVFSTCRVGGTGIGIAGLIGHNDGTLTNGYYVNTSYPITGANRTAGLIGWNTTTGLVQNTFTVADVAASTTESDVALHIGTFQGTVTNSFYDATRSVTNSGSGSTTENGTGIDTGTQPGYFFDKANPPLSSWDFATTWLQRAGDYPVLRWLANR